MDKKALLASLTDDELIAEAKRRGFGFWRREEMADRRDDIVRLRRERLSFAKIGEKVGVSGNRARDIFEREMRRRNGGLWNWHLGLRLDMYGNPLA